MLELLADLAGTRDATEVSVDTSEFETIRVDGPLAGVARITLNRPEKRNAISYSHALPSCLGRPRGSTTRSTEVKVRRTGGAGVLLSAGYDLGGHLRWMTRPGSTPQPVTGPGPVT